MSMLWVGFALGLIFGIGFISIFEAGRNDNEIRRGNYRTVHKGKTSGNTGERRFYNILLKK